MNVNWAENKIKKNIYLIEFGWLVGLFSNPT